MICKCFHSFTLVDMDNGWLALITLIIALMIALVIGQLYPKHTEETQRLKSKLDEVQLLNTALMEGVKSLNELADQYANELS